MPARVMVISLDGADSTHLERWSSEGDLSTINGINAAGSAWRLKNSMGTLPGGLWPEITSGRSCGKVGHYMIPRQLHTGEARRRPITSDEIDPEEFYWSVASRAGHRVAVMDLPDTVKNTKLNGVQIVGWGLHDPEFDSDSHPADIWEELVARHGAHPVSTKAGGRCDHYAKSRKGYEELLDDLLEGIKRRTNMLLDVIKRENWDLFTCSFSETHCVGHHFWHFHDAHHYCHDPSAPARLKDAVRTVYTSVDEAVGKLIEAAGSDSTVLLLAPQGMSSLTGGSQLIPEVIVRLGMGSDASSAEQTSIIRWVHAKIKQYAPWRTYSFLRRVGQIKLVKRLESEAGCLLDPLESPNTRAAALQNNRIGAIRLNLKGREPFGCVEPGPEAEALIGEMRNEFFALQDPSTNEPLVENIMTADELFGTDHHPDVPDLIVEFRTDLGLIESCRSDRVGLVHVPLGRVLNVRSGDHRVNGRLWAVGASIPAGTELFDANVLDVAPTVLKLLDVTPPNYLDGQPLPVV